MFAILKIIIVLCIGFAFGWKFFAKDNTLKAFSNKETLSLRGILCLLIIFGHATHDVAEQGAMSWDTVGRWCNWAIPVVSTFFFLSGYGVQKGYAAKGRVYLQGFWGKRLRKLLPALIIVSIMAAASRVYFLGYQWVDTVRLTSGILPLGLSWYVYALMLFYAFFWFTAKISESCMRLSHTASSVIILLLTIVYMYATYSAGWGGHYYVSAPGFILGYWYSGVESEVKQYVLKHTVLSSFGIVLLLMCLVPLRFIPLFGVFGEVTVYWFVPLALVLICYLGGFPKWKWLCFIGGISYELYLVHEVFLIAFHSYASYGWWFVAIVYLTSIPMAWCIRMITSNNKYKR